MSIMTIILLILAVCGIVWAYPRLPAPWNLVLVGLVAIACVLVLLNLSGVNLGIHG